MTIEHVCLNPWNYLCIEFDGECFFCCSVFTLNRYSAGNIFSNNLDEIWNGERAKEIRKDILAQQYSHCNIKACKNIYKKYHSLYPNIDSQEVLSSYPSVIQLNYDKTCASRCIFCRDEIEAMSESNQKKWDGIIDSKLIPLLSNTKLLILNGSGELFDSKHSKNLLKKVIEINPNIKLEIFSNGAKFNKENIDLLNISDKIDTAHISVSAATSKTYKRIYRKDNFNEVTKNVRYLCDLKKEGKIRDITLGFVINSVNYKEMKLFMKWANKLGVNVSFTLTSNHMDTIYLKNENYAVWKPSHYLYNDFVSILEDPIFKSNNCYLDFDSNFNKIPNIVIIKNFVNFIKQKLLN